MLISGFRIVIISLVLINFIQLSASPLDPIVYSQGFFLNSFIRHYEPARYNPSALVTHYQNRYRRNSSPRKQDIQLEIRGHGRVFRLRLTPDKEVFTEDVHVESEAGPLDFRNDIAYSGSLEDEENASVHGVITKEGLFDGMISTALENFYIEPVSRYLNFSDESQETPTFHSVIYKTEDVENPHRNVPCASHLLQHGLAVNTSHNELNRTKRWVLSGEGKVPIDLVKYSTNPIDTPSLFPMIDTNVHPIDEEMTASALSSFDTFRNKRTTIDPKKTTCMLYLQADHHFFQKYGSEEACIEVMTRHVQRVNSIYKVTDFNQDGKPDNISFMIKRIKVHTTDALRDPLYRFPGNYGVEKFLELFSEEDYDAFCLAYMFTYRDFEMGTLGLAWTGDLKNAGGVCEKNGHYRGSMKSLNTGIVTLLNYGKHVPPAVSHVTLAHEIGHNFGSPHDPERCTPGGEDGNFIMFARATSGDKKNNNKFSQCSINSINPVLNFKARSSKGCFAEPQKSICGNGVVEEGEECDCGWEEDCRDQCCYPQRRYPPLDEPPCRLTPRSVCSPSQGPCCSADCQVKFGNKCRDDNGCRDASFCNGRSAHCPPSINKPNKTICNQEFVCFMGECTGSICLAYGLESCQCIPGPNDPKTKACELCCKLPGEKQPCKSSFDWNETPYDVPDMYSKPGTPCNNYNGYCDVFQKCREVDPSGPLATLRKLLLSEESIASFRKWVMDYWYAVALIVFAVITVLVLSTKLFGKKPETKLKKVTIMHSSKRKNIRLPKTADGVTVHPALRSKLPLRRKVHNGKIQKKHRSQDGKIKKNNTKKLKKSSNSKKTSVTTAATVQTKAVQEQENTKTENTIVIPETGTITGAALPNKTKKLSPLHKSKNRKKKKKVIDYSCMQGGDGDGKKELVNTATDQVHNPLSPPTADPVNKVQNWLMKSQLVLPKSKSTPANLTTDKTNNNNKPSHGGRLKYKSDKTKAHSTGNIAHDKEKVRLQVVYKPPFKFSVKLRKPDKISAVLKSGVENAIKKKDPKIVKPRTGLLIHSGKEKKSKTAVASNLKSNQIGVTVASPNLPPLPLTPPLQPNSNNNVINNNNKPIDDIDSNIHTVQSDLEVLLSESEFLFSEE
ncbi:disintegrin and metalloproteinase domain-containing protein 10 [Agrilus planipennis]|uniref:ADAM10 endopeptidase n=1 Tax=Agrilus planipennis TaxID=224129 RepID=A0A1W4WMP9_AGRPL|nr:disintegrin and metalloproteinase domain-containing protein 10 [Agrilus planipennis]